MDARTYLQANRCPHCTHRMQPACPYVVRELKGGGGFKCYGYRSRYWEDGWKAVKQ